MQIVPRDIDAHAALDVAQGTASSAGGLVWETRDGDVRYADADHRRGTTVALDLDACDVLVTPTWSRNLSGLVNELSFGYGLAPAGGGEQSRLDLDNPESVAKFGRYGYTVTTQLATESDAYSAAWLILTQNRAPTWALNALPIDVAGLPLDVTKALLGLDMHSLIRVGGLPATGATPTAIVAWIEGWTERLAFGLHELEVTISDYCRTVPGVRWNDVTAATTWDNYGTGTWDDAACPGGPLPNLGRWDDVPATTRWDMLDPALDWDEVTL